MEAELKALEDKISQLVQLCQRLRAENLHLRQEMAGVQNENHLLRQEMASVQSENHLLAGKIGAAKGRLENLLQQIPEETE